MKRIFNENQLTPLALLLGALLVLPACNKDAEETATDEAAVEEPVTAGPPLDPETLPAVVANVNGEEIAKDTLVRQAAGRRQQMIQGGFPPATEDATFYRDVLDQIVGGMLLFDEADAKGMIVPEEEVERQVAAIRGGFPDETTFVAALESQNTTPEELSESIRQELSIRRLIDESIMSQIDITDDAKKSYYDANLDKMQHPEQVRVRHILVPFAQDADATAKAAALSQANDLKTELDGGADFAALAKEHSADTTSAQLGGELPWIGPGQTVPPFETTSYSLAKGEISDPVETRFGYHIIELLDRKEAGVLAYDQVAPRIGQVLQEEQLRMRLDELVENLKSQASIEIFM